jgi:hypothetical protein
MIDERKGLMVRWIGLMETTADRLIWMIKESRNLRKIRFRSICHISTLNIYLNIPYTLAITPPKPCTPPRLLSSYVDNLHHSYLVGCCARTQLLDRRAAQRLYPVTRCSPHVERSIPTRARGIALPYSRSLFVTLLRHNPVSTCKLSW